MRALTGIKADIKDRHVVIIEDIVESGNTITAVIAELHKLGPASVRLASCFLKTGISSSLQKVNRRLMSKLITWLWRWMTSF